MSDNLEIWRKLAEPPKTALKEIKGGRLSGKTDINPQWRMQAITEQFGPVGFGWAYTIDRLWIEPGAHEEVAAFAQVSVRVKHKGEWSEPFPGIGGNLLIAREKSGLHTSDEAYKMAVTDALSVAFKALGVAAEIYLGNYDGSKYTGKTERKEAPQPSEGREDINNRIRKALFATGCRTPQDAAAKVKRMTGFKAKDGKEVPGKEDYHALSDKAATFLMERLEKEMADKRDEDADAGLPYYDEPF